MKNWAQKVHLWRKNDKYEVCIPRYENRQLKSKEQKNLLNIKKEEADGGNDKASDTLAEDLNGGVDFLFSQRTENKSLSGLS